jgi:hypothetical protein
MLQGNIRCRIAVADRAHGIKLAVGRQQIIVATHRPLLNPGHADQASNDYHVLVSA